MHQDGINFVSATAILSNPFLLFEIFEQRTRIPLPLSLEAKRLVREFLYLVDDACIESYAAFRKFVSVINDPNSFETLDQIFETGFLGTFIPEFEQVRRRFAFARTLNKVRVIVETRRPADVGIP